MSRPGPPGAPRRAAGFERLIALALGLAVLGASQIPFAWAVRGHLRGDYPNLVFAGAPPTYADEANTYWAWMRQARDGRVFFTDLYTPEEHPRTYVNVLFWTLGTICRLTGGSLVLVYSIARVVFGAALIALLWALSRRLFPRPGERLACFFMLLLASGWGALGAFIEMNFGGPHVSSPVWWTPEMNTFFSLMLFPHFLAGFVCMVGAVLLIMRAWGGPEGEPAGATRRAAAAGSVMFLLTFFHPYDVVPVFATIWTAPLLFGAAERRWPLREWRLSLVASAVWLPAFLYNFWVFRRNAAMRAWDLQNIMITPDAAGLLIGFGVNLPLAALALAAFRRLPRPPLVMAAWFLSTLALIHLPVRFQRRMIGGIQFPLAALAATGILVVLVPFLLRLAPRLRRWRLGGRRNLGMATLLVAAAFAPLQALSPYYLMHNEWDELRRRRYPAWIRGEPWAALKALEGLGPPESVVLASYEMGNFVPPNSGHRCMLGHYALTIDALGKEREIARFFSAGEEDDAWRVAFLRQHGVRYVLHTAHERALGSFDPAARPWLEELFARGDDPAHRAAVYAVRLPEESGPASSMPSP